MRYQLFLVAIVGAFSFGVQLANSSDEQALGERLVRQYSADLKSGDMSVIAPWFAKGFQSVHQDGASNREETLKLAKNLDLQDYALSDIKITRNGPVIVATYFVSVTETLKGKRLVKQRAPRLAVFLKTEAGWKTIARANLVSLNQ
jgi:hypothetical protein